MVASRERPVVTGSAVGRRGGITKREVGQWNWAGPLTPRIDSACGSAKQRDYGGEDFFFFI
ncbi:hypothetical protein JZ751_019812 [Albula glossodonta]|uniref:Uncharacterized protein n=1 Tax=Albula glossodonta TaxID=121402 RepID=A0A8T2NU66_9TELE|nr:hypothetical protein JZ751_019812 [Albula glossodonta]